jgi:hypothetical protein
MAQLEDEAFDPDEQPVKRSPRKKAAPEATPEAEAESGVVASAVLSRALGELRMDLDEQEDALVQLYKHVFWLAVGLTLVGGSVYLLLRHPAVRELLSEPPK